MTRPAVFAHRGLSADHAENTVAALQAAAEAGFDGVEVDLRLTHDGEVVLLHDAGIERTTDGSGRVADMDYDDLRRHDTGEGPVPRLDDAFAILRGWSGLWNLELKTRGAVGPALDLVHDHGVADRTLISAMDPRTLLPAREAAADVERALIVLGPPDAADLDAARRLECTWLNLDHVHLDAAVVETVRSAGFRLGAWTVNDPGRAAALADLGAEAVITDTDDVRRRLAPGHGADAAG